MPARRARNVNGSYRLRASVVAFLAIVGVLAASVAPCAGQAGGGAVHTDSIKENLDRHAGKVVTVRLVSGEELTGRVAAVGGSVVHLAELARRDFYDAVVRIDQISALILRMRGQ